MRNLRAGAQEFGDVPDESELFFEELLGESELDAEFDAEDALSSELDWDRSVELVGTGAYSAFEDQEADLAHIAAYEVDDGADAVEGGAAEQARRTLFRMRVDGDRNGRIDSRPPPRRWTWGPRGRGAIILCNVDNDAPGTDPDNADTQVDQGNDPARDLAPLKIEPTPGSTVPSGTTLELTVSPAGSIRIFSSRQAGASQIIGPGTSTYRFPRLPTGARVLGMEATRFAGQNFDGLITITLRTRTPAGNAVRQVTQVRVAPWIMAHHYHTAQKVFVVDAGAFNQQFRTRLNQLVTAAGAQLVEHRETRDIWMQDVMQFGWTSMRRGFRVVFRSPQDRALKTFPPTLLGADFGYTHKGTPASDTTFDSHGNLECSPAVTVRGKRYPYGRIYYGPGDPVNEPMNQEVRDFLEAQLVQKPFTVDTNWLTVGHVDEVVTFVPARRTSASSPNNPHKMLIASPRLAYSMLSRLARSHPTAKIFTGRSIAGTSIEMSLQSFMQATDDINPELRANMQRGAVRHRPGPLRMFNRDCQRRLDQFKATMKRELGLRNSDIIEIPAIFMRGAATPTLADALIAGMVNMLVVNRHCIIPKPFGPVVNGVDKFEQDVERKLRRLGRTVRFLDCWDTYHVNLGEVHCATNTLRAPSAVRWWRWRP